MFHGRDYLNNMTTTTDLNYRYKINKNPMKSYVSVPDIILIRFYLTLLIFKGNLTHFGLTDWVNCMRYRPDHRAYTTLANDSYKCPANSALAKNRFATPANISTRLNQANLINKNLQLRNQKALNITDPKYICVY